MSVHLYTWLFALGLAATPLPASEGGPTPSTHASVPVAGVTSGLAEVPGGTLYYEAAGAGPALVLMHSGGFDRRIWDDQFEALASRFRVIRYDIRGFGRSPMARADHSDVDDLRALLHSLHVDKAALIGVSLGGRIAIDFALAHPDMVTALVLVATGVSGYEFSDDFYARVRAVTAAAQVDGAQRAAQLWLEDPLFIQARQQPKLRDTLLQIAAANADGWRTVLQTGGPPALGRLSEIRAPTLVVVGDRDIPDIQEVADRVAHGIPGAKKVVIPETDHALNMERPQEFNRIVLEFLAPLGSATR